MREKYYGQNNNINKYTASGVVVLNVIRYVIQYIVKLTAYYIFFCKIPNISVCVVICE